MSAPKFTPGPWVAVIRDPKTAGVRTAWTIESDSRVCIAWGQSQEHIADGIHADECNANAHLAASAPEMYEALERLLRTGLIDGGTRCAECEQHVENTSLRTCEWCSARAVLAKAVPQ